MEGRSQYPTYGGVRFAVVGRSGHAHQKFAVSPADNLVSAGTRRDADRELNHRT